MTENILQSIFGHHKIGNARRAAGTGLGQFGVFRFQLQGSLESEKPGVHIHRKRVGLLLEKKKIFEIIAHDVAELVKHGAKV